MAPSSKSFEEEWYEREDDIKEETFPLTLTRNDQEKIESYQVSLKEMKRQERMQEQSYWEVQKMADSGIIRKAVWVEDERDSLDMNILKVKDLKPDFLKDYNFNSSLRT